MTKLKEGVRCEERSVSTASSKVEEMMRAESRMSHFSKPEQEENENKGQYAWRLIRHCVKNAIDLVNKADIKDMVISHGVHQNRRLNHVNPVNQILHNKKTKVVIIFILDPYHPLIEFWCNPLGLAAPMGNPGSATGFGYYSMNMIT